VRDLAGGVAVVTGGGSGIGAALAVACAGAGMKTVVADLDGGAAEAVARRVRDAGGAALAVETDVSDRASVEALAERTYAELGACHLLCNNAGVLVIGPAVERSEDEWRRVLDVNVLGVVHGVAAFVPRMRAQPRDRGPAHILNTASVSGLVPVPGMGAYVTSKFAVVGLSESLRADLEAEGIGVTLLCPAGVKTPLIGAALRRAGGSEAAREGIAHLEKVAATTREGAEDLAAPEAVAEAALEGVRRGARYVVTGPMYRTLVEQRMGHVLAAFDAIRP